MKSAQDNAINVAGTLFSTQAYDKDWGFNIIWFPEFNNSAHKENFTFRYIFGHGLDSISNSTKQTPKWKSLREFIILNMEEARAQLSELFDKKQIG